MLLSIIAELQAIIFKAVSKTEQLKQLELPLVHDEVGQEIMITMVKDSSIT